MGLRVTQSNPADLGWNKRVFLASDPGAGSDEVSQLWDFSRIITDSQIDSNVETEEYFAYGSPDAISRATSFTENIVINDSKYTATFNETIVPWLEESKSAWWNELFDVNSASSAYANKGTFNLVHVGVEGFTITGPTNAVMTGTPSLTAQGAAFGGTCYPFEIAAAGDIDLVGTVDDVTAAQQLWLMVTEWTVETQGTAPTFTLTIGADAADALSVSETTSAIYNLPKKNATDAGSITLAMAGATTVKGYLLVGKSTVGD